MSRANVKIRLANASRLELSPVEIEAVADSEQMFLRVPARLAARLRLKAVDLRTVPNANGGYETLPYVGPVELLLGTHTCFVGAVVDGSHVRVGSIALDSMNLVVDPTTHEVVPNPRGPSRIGRLAIWGKI